MTKYVSEFADPVVAENYSPLEVYNTDKTGLNFKAVPKESLASKKRRKCIWLQNA